MTVYKKVVLECNGVRRGILCEGPQGPSPLIAIYNSLIIHHTTVPGDESPMEEESVKEIIRAAIQNNLGFLQKDKLAAIEDFDTIQREVLSLIDDLPTRLDVYPHLDCIMDFEVNYGYLLFTFLGINLLHGWVAPDESIYESVRGCSRDKLAEHLASLEGLEDDADNRALIQDLLNAADKQLTTYGFTSLRDGMDEGEYTVIFCNNGFSVIHKHEGDLFILETDGDVRSQFPSVTWRLFEEVEGDSIYLTRSYIPVKEQPNLAKARYWYLRKLTKIRTENVEASSNVEPATMSEKVEASTNVEPTTMSEKAEGSSRSLTKFQRRRLQKKAKQGLPNEGVKKQGESHEAAIASHGEISENQGGDDKAAASSHQETKNMPASSPCPAADDDEKKQAATASHGEPYEENQGEGDKAAAPSHRETKDVPASSPCPAVEDDEKKQAATASHGEPFEENQGGIKAAASSHQEIDDVPISSPCADAEYKIKQAAAVSDDDMPYSQDQPSACETSSCTIATDEEISMAVDDFSTFLLEFQEDDSSAPYLEGIAAAIKVTRSQRFYVPYEFIMVYDEGLAMKIQDYYPRISKNLTQSVVQYLARHEISHPNVELKIFGLPEPKSVQSFEDFVASIDLLDEYDVYGDGLDESPSYDGRKMALGYLRCILKKFRMGKCCGGKWSKSNMKVTDSGSNFFIDCEDEDLTPDRAYLDLAQFSFTVLERFRGKRGKLPPYFHEFDNDCQKIPDYRTDRVKWERFLELMSSPLALKPPLVRSAFICNVYLVANSNSSGNPPKYGPLNSRQDSNDWRATAKKHVLFAKVYDHNNYNNGRRTTKLKYFLDRWTSTPWSLFKFSRHFIQHVLRHTKGKDLVQKIQDIAIVDMLLSRKLGEFIARSVRFLVLNCGIDDLFSSAWRHFVASECTDKPRGNIGLKDAVAIEELLSSVSPEKTVGYVYATVGIPSEPRHKSVLISDADLSDFLSLLKENGLKVTQEDDILCCGSITVFKTYPVEEEGTDSYPVVAVEGPYCEEYNVVFELLGVWLGL